MRSRKGVRGGRGEHHSRDSIITAQCLSRAGLVTVAWSGPKPEKEREGHSRPAGTASSELPQQKCKDALGNSKLLTLAQKRKAIEA